MLNPSARSVVQQSIAGVLSASTAKTERAKFLFRASTINTLAELSK